MNLKPPPQVPFSRESRALLIKEAKPLRIVLQAPLVPQAAWVPGKGKHTRHEHNLEQFLAVLCRIFPPASEGGLWLTLHHSPAAPTSAAPRLDPPTCPMRSWGAGKGQG